MCMSPEIALKAVFLIGVLCTGILGKLASEEATPREGAVMSYWFLEPNHLSTKGRSYRTWFNRVMLLNLTIFVTWLVLYK